MKIVFSLIMFTVFSFKMSACSAFFFNAENKLLAKNFDWYSGEGYILKNNKGKTKYAYGFRMGTVAKWTSKYGSITFNQIGKEFPYGGINEKGLVVEQLWLASSQYQENNNAQISELEWIQYQLDNYATVDEVDVHLNKLTIKPIAYVHYILADSTGNSSVIEYINGKAVITKKSEGCQVITNSTAKISEYYFQKSRNIYSNSRKSINRYCILKHNLSNHSNTVEEAFEKLDLVSEDRDNYKTFWNIVYDIDKLEIHFKSYNNREVKTIKLADFDFREASKILFCPINLVKVNFNEYTGDDNLKLLSTSLKMMDIMVDVPLANDHQMEPSLKIIDTVFQNKYIDLRLDFTTKKENGKIFYSLIQGEKNFETYTGVKSGVIPVATQNTTIVLYNIPKGTYALASFQDTNNDSKMDKNFLGVPKNIGFSNNVKNVIGNPKGYDKVRMVLDKTQTIEIKIE